jgi:hypothetical protein
VAEAFVNVTTTIAHALSVATVALATSSVLAGKPLHSQRVFLMSFVARVGACAAAALLLGAGCLGSCEGVVCYVLPDDTCIAWLGYMQLLTFGETPGPAPLGRRMGVREERKVMTKMTMTMI